MSESWSILLALPAAIAALVIVVLARSRFARIWLDHPNARSLHASPTPRFGGIGLMAGALPVAAAFAGDRFDVALLSALVLALVSAVDDWRPLPIVVRLPVHLLAAAAMVTALVHGAPSGAPALLGAVGLVLAVTWMTNLYNFMDGADGLAGLMASIGFAVLAFAAVQAGDPPLAAACAAIASASLGFLAFNAPPARIFLGDAGSVPLGFLAAALGAYGAVDGTWPGWFPVLVFSPFVVDATLTFAKRLVRGERVWVAHRSHYYQELVLGGWSVRRLVVAEGLLMLAAGASALYARRQGVMLQCGILAGWSVLYGILVVALEMKRFKKKSTNGIGARRSNRAPGEQE